MSKMSEATKDLRDTVEDLSNNIKLLKTAEEINLIDCKTLFTEIFEVLKDVLEKFVETFDMVEKIMNINKATVKEEIEHQDFKTLYL